MLKGAKRFFLLFFSCLALFIMPLRVSVVRLHADTISTYYDLTECTAYEFASNNRYRFIESSSPTRFVVISNNNSTTEGTVFLVSTSLFTFGSLTNTANNRCPMSVLPSTSESHVVNGVTYYVGQASNYETTANELYVTVPINPAVYNNGWENAIYYTYGAGAVDPVTPVNYGLINNLGYHTNIAGSGNAAINNFDVISWDSVTDTLGNTLPQDATINIRVVPGNYSAASKQGLLEKLYSDFILNRTDLVQVASVSASQEYFKIAWRTVVDRLNIPFSSINSLISTDETWLKYGWIYECQLSIPSAGYTGEWQTVYTSTSSGVENDMTIINNSVAINQDLINVMQSINVLNDNDTIWYLKDVPVDPDPTYTPPEDDTEEPWYMKILEMIYNSIGITNEYINNGTSQSQNESDILNSNNNTLNTTVNEYHIVEDEIVQDMDNNIQSLDIESELLSETGFLNSARWISEQFTRIITDNPIGLILKFSLILGVALIFLGRFR